MSSAINPERVVSLEQELLSTFAGYSHLVSPEVRVYQSVNSTMDISKQLASSGEIKEPAVVMSLEQTAGRGRMQRSWISQKGGLYVTIALPVDAEVNLSGLSLVMGLSLLNAINPAKQKLFLKWPNDLLSADREKLAGILIERSVYNNKTWVLVGVGVNVISQPDLPSNFASLQKLGIEISVLKLAENLFVEIQKDWQKFEEHGFEAFRSNWLENCAHINSSLETTVGDKKISGRFVGVDEQGVLLLDIGDKELLHVTAGDVVCN